MTLLEQLKRHINQMAPHQRDRVGGLLMKEAMGEIERLREVLNYISTSDTGGELFPVGPSDTEYAEDGNTVLRHIGPWHFLRGKGDTFLDAVEDAIKKDKA